MTEPLLLPLPSQHLAASLGRAGKTPVPLVRAPRSTCWLEQAKLSCIDQGSVSEQGTFTCSCDDKKIMCRLSKGGLSTSLAWYVLHMCPWLSRMVRRMHSCKQTLLSYERWVLSTRHKSLMKSITMGCRDDLTGTSKTGKDSWWVHVISEFRRGCWWEGNHMKDC